MTRKPEDPRLDKLRRALTCVGDRDWPAQVRSIERLRRRYHHTIEPFTGHGFADERLLQFTCFAFAFGIVEWTPFFDWIARPNVNFGCALAQQLVGQTSENEEASDGDLALYFTNTSAVHAGVVSGSRVRSKWSTGRIWEHDLFETPAQHGWILRYFRMPPLEFTIEQFEMHAERQTAKLRR